MLNYLFKALTMSFCIDIELIIWYNEGWNFPIDTDQIR